jgi:hypothetical protein
MPQSKNETISVLSFDSKYERHEPTDAAQGKRVLHFQRRQEMGGYYFTAGNYRMLRDFFAKMHAADEQQVVLVPAQPIAAK